MGIGLAMQARGLRLLDRVALRRGRAAAPHLVTGLEGERETSKNVIAHLKHDIALSPVKGRRGGKRTSEV